MGASTVKWTILDPCSCLSESYPKLYTNFEFYEIKIHKHLENIWYHVQSQAIYVHKLRFQTTYIYLEEGASGEKVGDFEKIIVKTLFKL